MDGRSPWAGLGHFFPIFSLFGGLAELFLLILIFLSGSQKVGGSFSRGQCQGVAGECPRACGHRAHALLGPLSVLLSGTPWSPWDPGLASHLAPALVHPPWSWHLSLPPPPGPEVQPWSQWAHPPLRLLPGTCLPPTPQHCRPGL